MAMEVVSGIIVCMSQIDIASKTIAALAGRGRAAVSSTGTG